ncbi:hypothetical protein HRR83_001838 [Exophiala dermatitidis]|uniref:Ribosomal protein s17 n=1 Tax=Exophiala dermatitidis TaxID=5970 RepID=A0AAN6F0T2_EXODE|nr:hypothetical protein HRR73_004969 [Exophiala dermatitidis]KAJ4523293.1 hypothetical protein HRR75_001694 [Exophiala dermatitidis]KAJ4526641.1 hypothetical protein HRR74_001841 [Exophiala dermatitidis]KAJ4532110.1 hypothetical protein HRR76_007109 [Exophiala dermatitidis]KAJ4546145.1 hypothetical protein HRR77_004682 [Exophiala dermatitidis]
MKTTQLLTVAVAALGFASSTVAQRGGNRGGGNNNNKGGAAAASATTAAAATASKGAATGNNNNGGTSNTNTGGAGGNNGLALLAANVQKASNSPGGSGDAGQAPSDTDPANFINFCTGKTLTNGAQVTQGSCNGIVMGDIPSNNNMVSSIILFPGPGDDITPNQSFNVQVQISNLEAGSFTDPTATYYAAPQALKNGNVVGHCHVTIQDLGGNIATKTPPDPKKFAFFKGINDDGNGNGLLQATVTNGLPAGVYRVCTMNSASNHQPVLMPVAQRGAQDDCTKFTVGQGTGNAGNTGNAAGNTAGKGGNTGNTGNTGNAGNGNKGTGAAASSSAAASATTSATGSTATNATGKTGTGKATTGAGTGAGAGNTGGNTGNTGAGRGGQGGQGGQGGRGGAGGAGGAGGRFGRGRGRFAARDFIA